MRFIPNSVTRKVARAILVSQKNSPTLLFGAGVVGVIGTVVLASRATLKVEETMDNNSSLVEAAKELRARNDEDYSEQDYQKDMVYIYVRNATAVLKLYAPAIGLGVLSIAALTGSHVILSKRNVALTAAYAAVEKAIKEYRERIVGEIGEDHERELWYGTETREIVEETETGPQTRTVVSAKPGAPSMYAKFFDEFSTSWRRDPERNVIFLRSQQNYANDRLQARGHLMLNDVYDMLGIERTKAGCVVGWVLGHGDNNVDFGIYDNNNPRARDFVNGREGSFLLDFNVDGVVYNLLGD